MSGFGMPDKIPGDEYVLHMDAETAQIVARACELYARVRCGQFDEIQYLTVQPQDDHDPTFGDRIQKCREALYRAREAAFPDLHGPGHSYGVGKLRDSDTAWNVYQAVRYVKAWHEHPEGGYTVDFKEPLRYSDAPMPRCEVRNGDIPGYEYFVDPRTKKLMDAAVKEFREKYGGQR